MKLNLVLLTAAFAKDKQKYCDDDCDGKPRNIET